MWEVASPLPSFYLHMSFYLVHDSSAVRAKSEKDEASDTLEIHLFRAFKGVAAQRADHSEPTVILLKKSAIEIIDGDYEAPSHQHAFVGETRVPDAGRLRVIELGIYKIVSGWLIVAALGSVPQ
jgi:hypothetical protein